MWIEFENPVAVVIAKVLVMLAAHVVFGTYGFWLPNDPRGSWSTFVGSHELLRFGPATKTVERRSLAHVAHDRSLRLAAKAALKRPPVELDEPQRQAVGDGIGEYCRKSGLKVWACAVMTNHVHLVIAASSMSITQRVIQFKGAATRTLLERRLHPFERDVAGVLPKCFALGEWKVYLDDAPDVERTVAYVRRNPVRDGFPPQRWEFLSDWRRDLHDVEPVREPAST